MSGIVAAFMGRPDLLIVDDPTTGVDSLKRDLLSRWRAIVGWRFGLILFAAMYASIFLEVEERQASRE